MNKLKSKIKQVCKSGKFVLTSGRESDFYVNIKELMLEADSVKLLGKELYKAINLYFCTHFPSYVGGMELGSVPLTTAICTYSAKRVMMDQFIIRKTPRTHGTCSQVEGWDNIENEDVVLVDDVLTTGNSLRKMIEVLGDHCNVVGCIVVVDRQDVPDEDLVDLPPIISLFTKEDLIDEVEPTDPNWTDTKDRPADFILDDLLNKKCVCEQCECPSKEDLEDYDLQDDLEKCVASPNGYVDVFNGSFNDADGRN